MFALNCNTLIFLIDYLDFKAGFSSLIIVYSAFITYFMRTETPVSHFKDREHVSALHSVRFLFFGALVCMSVYVCVRVCVCFLLISYSHLLYSPV